VRAPGDGSEKVRAAAAGDAAAAAALWDAHGPRAYAFSRRVVGEADVAADATQDAFLLALRDESGDPFDIGLLRATRHTSFELLAAGRGAGRRDGSGLGAAAGRLRPQQRAALALSGLERLPYAQLAAVLGIGVEAVPALLARARLRLHDELHGTALAAAAVSSPDCEDVVPLLAAAADGELDAADAAWADPHVLRCPTCPRTRRAMVEAAATYAAWSPAASPSWLRGATLADVGAEAQGIAPVLAAAWPPPQRRARRRAAGVWATPRPGLSAALVGATLVTASFAGLMLAGSDALRPDGRVRGGARLGGSAGSVQVAVVPEPRRSRTATHQAPRRTHRTHRTARAQRVSFVRVASVRRVAASAPARSQTPTKRTSTRPRRTATRPRPTRKSRPAPSEPAPTTPAATGNAPVPASPAAPADETPTTSTVAASAPASTPPDGAVPTTTAPASAPAPSTPTRRPAMPTPSPKPLHSSSVQTSGDWRGGADDDRWRDGSNDGSRGAVDDRWRDGSNDGSRGAGDDGSRGAGDDRSHGGGCGSHGRHSR
jgi:DNA-directed RNA polymerase specialized sigma24 family protein